MRVFLKQPMEPEALEKLSEFAEVITPQNGEWVDKVDVVYTKLGQISVNSTMCEYVACPCTNIDHIHRTDVLPIYLDERWKKGVGRYVSATAELAWALYMALIRKIIPAHQHVVDGGWDRNLFQGQEIAGKTALIIGLGRVGSQIDYIAQAFGMTVFAYDKGIRGGSLNYYLSKADVVFICCTSDASTENLIGWREFRLMKPTAFLINTARSEIVEPKALLKTLQNKSIAGVGLDVMEAYDFYEWLDLMMYAEENDNLIITPHIAGNTRESRIATDLYIVDRIKEIADERNLR